jgi:vacuolar iron transporter family protein
MMAIGALSRLLHRAPQSRHRDVKGSGLRAAVLGAGDGLLTNVSLVLGVAGAHPSAGTVRLAGIAGLLSGAFSMAAGELVSVRAHDELVNHEIGIERQELRDDPVGEEHELADMLADRGLDAQRAGEAAGILMSNPDVALDTHARMELGVDPQQPGSALQAAIASFLSFALGAAVPLIPWLLWSDTTATVAAVAASVVAALALGATIGEFTAQGRLRTALRQLAAGIVAASVTYVVGSVLGDHTL